MFCQIYGNRYNDKTFCVHTTRYCCMICVYYVNCLQLASLTELNMGLRWYVVFIMIEIFVYFSNHHYDVCRDNV